MARPFKGTTFWDRVYSHVERDGECLMFTGSKDDCGYGRINRDGKLVRLHRAVWERNNGPIPAEKVIMHTCDRPACIEPSHLQLGTQGQNIADMTNKGRRITVVGEQHGRAKITEQDVRDIRYFRSVGVRLQKLAYKYGLSETMISLIAKRKFWKHVQ